VVIRHLDRQGMAEGAGAGCDLFCHVVLLASIWGASRGHCVCVRSGNDKSLNTTMLLAMHFTGISARSAENQLPSTVRRPSMHKEVCHLVARVESQVH
jgi:hypothetical protein